MQWASQGSEGAYSLVFVIRDLIYYPSISRHRLLLGRRLVLVLSLYPTQNTMADNPNLRGRDGNTVSWQDHEIAYVKDRAKTLYPKRTPAEIDAAIRACKAAISPSEGR